MTIRYVRSGAGGIGTGLSWANAINTIQPVIDVCVPGDEIYVAQDHRESGTGFGIEIPPDGIGGGYGLPNGIARIKVTAIDHLTDEPTYVVDDIAFGSLVASGTSANFRSTGLGNDFVIRGDFHFVGVFFHSEDNLIMVMGPEVLTHQLVKFDRCGVVFGALLEGDVIFDTVRHVEFNGCSLVCGAGGPGRVFSIGDIGRLRFNGCIFGGFYSPIGGAFALPSISNETRVEFDDCNLTNMGTGVLIDPSGPHGSSNDITSVMVSFRNCALPTTFTEDDALSADLQGSNSLVTFEQCQIGANRNYYYRQCYRGLTRTDTDIYFNGVNGGFDHSYRYSADVASRPGIPAMVLRRHIWLPTGTHTLTVPILERYSTPLTAHTCWMRVQYFEADQITRTVSEDTHEFAQLAFTDLPLRTEADMMLDWTAPSFTNYRYVELIQTITTAKAGFATVSVLIGAYSVGRDANINPHVVVS